MGSAFTSETQPGTRNLTGLPIGANQPTNWYQAFNTVLGGPYNPANNFGGWLPELGAGNVFGDGSGGSPQNAPAPSNNVASAAQSQGSLAATSPSAGSPMLASQSQQPQYPSYSIPQVQGMSTDLLSQLAQYAQQAGKARS